MGATIRFFSGLEASPEAVYRAFAEPGAMERWLPPNDMTGEMLRFDFRDGGSYRMRLTYAERDRGQGKASDDTDEMTVRLTRLATRGRTSSSWSTRRRTRARARGCCAVGVRARPTRAPRGAAAGRRRSGRGAPEAPAGRVSADAALLRGYRARVVLTPPEVAPWMV